MVVAAGRQLQYGFAQQHRCHLFFHYSVCSLLPLPNLQGMIQDSQDHSVSYLPLTAGGAGSVLDGPGCWMRGWVGREKVRPVFDWSDFGRVQRLSLRLVKVVGRGRLKRFSHYYLN